MLVVEKKGESIGKKRMKQPKRKEEITYRKWEKKEEYDTWAAVVSLHCRDLSVSTKLKCKTQKLLSDSTFYNKVLKICLEKKISTVDRLDYIYL